MNDPIRLLIQGASEAERDILRSAAADGPPRDAVQRMMTTLDGLPDGSGAPGWPGPGRGTQAAARSLEIASLAKIGLAALLGVAGLTTGLVLHGRAGSPPEAVATPPARLPAQPATAASGETEPTPPPPLAPQQADSLKAELRLLDEARAALDARQPVEAARALDSHAQRFPQGHLAPEARVLRLAVLIRQGDAVAARSLGQELLASESYRTYAPRIRSLLRELRP